MRSKSGHTDLKKFLKPLGLFIGLVLISRAMRKEGSANADAAKGIRRLRWVVCGPQLEFWLKPIDPSQRTIRNQVLGGGDANPAERQQR